MHDVAMKWCSRCKCYKPASEYAWKCKKARQLGTYCKPCQREYCRRHYRRNSRKHNLRRHANRTAYKERNRDYTAAYLLKHPCVDCSEDNPVVLDFDHVRGDKAFDISRMISAGMPLARLQAEIDKCVVRCSNCHRKKTSRDFAWFKSRRAARQNDAVGGAIGGQLAFA